MKGRGSVSCWGHPSWWSPPWFYLSFLPLFQPLPPLILFISASFFRSDDSFSLPLSPKAESPVLSRRERETPGDFIRCSLRCLLKHTHVALATWIILFHWLRCDYILKGQSKKSSVSDGCIRQLGWIMHLPSASQSHDSKTDEQEEW